MSTAHSYFVLWDWHGTLERIHHALYVATRERPLHNHAFPNGTTRARPLPRWVDRW